MSEKLFYYDLETTGTKFWRNGIHQIAGMIEVDGKIVEEFNFNVKPYHDAEIEDEALEVAGITRADLGTYREMRDVYVELTGILNKYVDKFNKKDKFFKVGYNIAPFDDQFLRAWFVQNGDNYFGSYFWGDAIDLRCIAVNKLKGVRAEMENFKLVTVAKQLGIEVDEEKLHDAMYDIIISREIYQKLQIT